MRAISEPLAAPQVLADYFPTLLHDGLRSIPSNHRPGASSSRRIAVGSCQQRPKRPVTPYPGKFCRELHCFQYFAAQPCLQPQENKDFASKVWGGVGGAYASHQRVPPVPRIWGPGKPQTLCERSASVWPHRRWFLLPPIIRPRHNPCAVVLSKANPNGMQPWRRIGGRSEEHTSELQSRPYLVCRL